ncbi:Metabotropic GABA-B receptor subtype 3A [Irineochytrium annulatum]|nr:Metabotropic GABA-B receptor subtype 3A [Irineochytrium annulatum]
MSTAVAASSPALYAPLVIGVGFPISYAGDGGYMASIYDVMTLHLAGLQKNTSLHPAVRNATFDLIDLQLPEATYGIKGGLTLAQRNVPAAIGSAYSALTEGFSSALNAFGIPLCDGASTAPLLSDMIQYPNFFRTVCQDEYQAVAIFDFIVDQGWNEVAVVHAEDVYGQGLSNSAQVVARDRNITISIVQGYTPQLSDYQDAVDNVKASGTRIILFVGEFAEFVIISKQSYASGIFGAGYQWITTDSISGFNYTWVPMGGLINFFPEEGQGPLYEAFKEEWAADTSLGAETAFPPYPFAMFYLNCVEAFIYGFDRLFKQRPDLVAQPGHAYNLSSAIVVPDTFMFPDMDTVTGKVIYDQNGDRLGRYSISFYKESTGYFQEFATYDPNGVRYTGPIEYQGGSHSRPPSSSVDLAVATEISGTNVAAVLIYILSPLSLLLCVICGAATYYYRAEKVFRAASVEFLLIIIGGLILASLYPLLLTGAPSDAKCLAEIWVLPTAFSIIMGNLLSRTFRVYRIFANVFAASSGARNGEVMLLSLVILFSDVALSAVWTVASPPGVSWQVLKFKGDFYEKQSTCASANSTLESIFLGALFGWNAVILLAGVVLTILSRNIPSKYSETSAMALVIYNFFAVTVLIVPFGYFFTITKTAQVILKALGTFCCVWVSLGVLFGTKLAQVTGERVKKRASADEGAA